MSVHAMSTDTTVTKLRAIALTTRKACDAFRFVTADGQPLETTPTMFGAPALDSIGAAVTMDHACIAWLLSRGFTVTPGAA